MEPIVEQLADGLKRIQLIGRLDLQGTQAIATGFAEMAAKDDCRLIVDLSGVEYICSMTIHMLITAAKANTANGGRMVMCAPRTMVRASLAATGMDRLIPLYDDLDTAKKVLSK